jgi:hypothetical protein
MGQYHYICNLDKREYLDPHQFGDGLKLMEFGCSMGGTMTALAILLASANGRGGGDLRLEEDNPLEEIVGSWAGDRIAIIGDYFDEGDVPGWDMDDNPWKAPEGWAEISAPMRELIEGDGFYKFETEEWKLKKLDGETEIRTSINRVEA